MRIIYKDLYYYCFSVTVCSIFGFSRSRWHNITFCSIAFLWETFLWYCEELCDIGTILLHFIMNILQVHCLWMPCLNTWTTIPLTHLRRVDTEQFVHVWYVPFIWQNSLNSAASTCVPSSGTMVSWIPNWAIKYLRDWTVAALVVATLHWEYFNPLWMWVDYNQIHFTIHGASKVDI